MNTEELIELAVKAAIAGGKEIISVYESEDFGVEFKEDNSPLTKADVAANAAITEILNESQLPILSEEGRSIDFEERKNWDVLWIVDPLDGTKEFVKRNGEFTVNIALIQNGNVIGGVVYSPVSGELYFASSELGSLKTIIHSLSAWNEIKTSSTKLPSTKTDKYTVVASRSHPSPETTEFIETCKKEHGDIEIISRGSSLKLCMVAEGKADCYPRFAPTMEWDTAAGHAICKFANRQVIDYQSQEEMKYNREQLLNNWFLVQ